MLKFMAASFKTLDWMALQLPATPACIGIQSMVMEFVETDIMKYIPFRIQLSQICMIIIKQFTT